MSILSEYEEIRRTIGEDNYNCICEFLGKYPEYYLSDVYYNRDVFNQMVEETGFDESCMQSKRHCDTYVYELLGEDF